MEQSLINLNLKLIYEFDQLLAAHSSTKDDDSESLQA